VALYYVTNGTTSAALDLNQALSILMQPAGGQEVGHYILAMPAYAASATISNYVPSLTRHATPVSVTVDVTDVNNGFITTVPPNTDHLTANGFRVYDTPLTGAQANPIVGGVYTIQY